MASACSKIDEAGNISMYEIEGYDCLLKDSVTVAGKQGVARDDSYFYITDNDCIYKYDTDFNLIDSNSNPFDGIEAAVNHLGDPDIYNGKMYVPVEFFAGGFSANVHLAVYDCNTLKLLNCIRIDTSTGLTECSGAAVDSEKEIIWLSSWSSGSAGKYLYQYDLELNSLGKVQLANPSKWTQGIDIFDNMIIFSCDDGNNKGNYIDHLYYTDISYDSDALFINLFRKTEFLESHGELEGICIYDNFLYLIHIADYEDVIDDKDTVYTLYSYELKNIY